MLLHLVHRFIAFIQASFIVWTLYFMQACIIATFKLNHNTCVTCWYLQPTEPLTVWKKDFSARHARELHSVPHTHITIIPNNVQVCHRLPLSCLELCHLRSRSSFRDSCLEHLPTTRNNYFSKWASEFSSSSELLPPDVQATAYLGGFFWLVCLLKPFGVTNSHYGISNSALNDVCIIFRFDPNPNLLSFKLTIFIRPSQEAFR